MKRLILLSLFLSIMFNSNVGHTALINGDFAQGLTDWTHVSLGFQNSFAYVIPTFELFEQNIVDADSTGCIDNVSIQVSAVPESGTLLLLSSGLGGLLVLRRRRASKQQPKSV